MSNMSNPELSEMGIDFPSMPVPEPIEPDIKDIQRKSDESFLIVFNGLPFHATKAQTPDVYQLVIQAVEAGQNVTQYVEALVTDNELAATERLWRDGELEAVKWLRERHRDEQEINASTTLNSEQFRKLLEYIQMLRDWPQSTDFPSIYHRPLPPAWILSQNQ